MLPHAYVGRRCARRNANQQQTDLPPKVSCPVTSNPFLCVYAAGKTLAVVELIAEQ